ncbi:hypothetical protein BpHYR1_054365 [Brachionus plicatilis]|uniref:Uncharacterized protein n=1 Tax=Brachionus plicatilis TaxID=10195 RepID=A0A3M7RE14_BRAPC|nr:hypothetical protein BpHYR1_054365 [Brachionus plicatilis]
MSCHRRWWRKVPQPLTLIPNHILVLEKFWENNDFENGPKKGRSKIAGTEKLCLTVICVKKFLNCGKQAQATNTPSERLISLTGYSLLNRRNSVNPNKVEKIMIFYQTENNKNKEAF